MPDPLDCYHNRRSPSRTPEPFGSSSSQNSLFVVQQHAARKNHFDLRLQIGDTLKSWAVPHGPSVDPEVKRLAVHVEDHPVEYGTFEGVIPKGNYGAGSVIVWDRGQWLSKDPPLESYQEGVLHFELRGYKLRGVWTLVRTKRGNDWLLIKKDDNWAHRSEALTPKSIFSGLTVEEVAAGDTRAKAMRRSLKRQRLPPEQVNVARIRPMLATAYPAAFSNPGWLFELKYDGVRILAHKHQGNVTLSFRSERDATELFPIVARALTALPYESFLLDGEVVALDPEGKPSFGLLQRRLHLTRWRDIERADIDRPVTAYWFDLLTCEGHDLRTTPLTRRKDLLEKMIPPAGPLRYSAHIVGNGEDLYNRVAELGVEGIVAKRLDSPYVEGRSEYWRKVKTHHTDDFVVVGYRPLRSHALTIGSFHIAGYDGDNLRYVGRVGSGLTEAISERVKPLLVPVDGPECDGVSARAKADVWTAPTLTCEVRYAEISRYGYLRHPVFLSMREDKPPSECVLRTSATSASAGTPIDITNSDKIYWPESGITKGDLLSYYETIAPWMLPHLKDRPLVVDRYPNGIAGKHFFQKHAAASTPDWIRTAAVMKDEKRTRYIICNDMDTLLYLANLGTIPIHTWASRLTTLARPDWCVIDLDPKDAPFKHVIQLARELRSLCRKLSIPCGIKTSGATGLHILIPLGAQYTHEQCRLFGALIAKLLVQRLPDIATTEQRLSKRQGKVYVDSGQNGRGRLLVAAYSVRPLVGATVGVPLRWDEVRVGLDPSQFTIKTVPNRVKRMKVDPVIETLKQQLDLETVLQDLSRLL